MSEQSSRYRPQRPPIVAEGWQLERATPPSRMFGANGVRAGPDGRLYVSLVNIGDANAVPAIRDALKVEQSSEVRRALVRALSKSGGRSEAVFNELLSSSDPKVREIAVRGLAGNNAFNPWPWPWPRPRPFP